MAEIIDGSTMEALDTLNIHPNERYRLLAEEQRRLVLDILTGTTFPIELEELSVKVASHESGAPANDAVIRRVAISLHHNHLPRLADAGVLSYDQESHVIEPVHPL